MNTLDQHRLATLDRAKIEQRIRALAAEGYGDHEIARLLALHVHVVRRVLAEQSHANALPDV